MDNNTQTIKTYGNNLSDALTGACLCVDKDRGSVILGGVLLRREGDKLIIAATCGKVLIEYRVRIYDEIDAEPADWQAILTVQAAKSVAKLIKRTNKQVSLKGQSQIQVSCNEGSITVATAQESATHATIEGIYPPYESALIDTELSNIDYKGKDPRLMGFNPSLLSNLLKAMTQVMPKNQQCIVSTVNGAGRGTIYRPLAKQSSVQVIGLLMPINLPD